MKLERDQVPSGKCALCGAPVSTSGAEQLCPTCAGGPESKTQATASAETVVAPLNDPGNEISETFGSISGYQLLEELGQGGMGLVYRAQQIQPVRREVAVKIIKLGMDTKQIVARFEAERQALALMDHPNIARVFDAGATNIGRPYFVMELVRGTRITDYCDRHKLSTPERLELFIAVCRAVQHAHQKGIIHRDLKPSNILVTDQDGKAVPKVIDFGIAKATGQALTDKTAFTALSGILGTPAYMSPEQAEGGLDIDTRTDLYSLGVLLYELLTGTTPFETKELIEAGLDEMRRIIREKEPPTPSTRLKQELTAQQAKGSDKLKIKNQKSKIANDLDWIVMKAIEKERSRRYETANGLALDIQRYLQNEPVLASPPSFAYRAGKFVRRHKGPVLAGSLLMLVLVGGFVGTAWGLYRARLAQLAEAGQKAIAEAGQKFLLHDLLQQADAIEQSKLLREIGGGFKVTENPTIKELLDRSALVLAEDRIDKRFPGQLEVQASVLETVGNAYRGVGEYEKSATFLRRASALYRTLPAGGSTNALNVLNSLALTYLAADKPAEATQFAEQVRDARLKQLGPDHPDTLTAMNYLGVAYEKANKIAQAMQLFQQVRDGRVKKLGSNHPDTLYTQTALAVTYLESDKVNLGFELLDKTYATATNALGADDPLTLKILHNLASAYQMTGPKSKALELFVQCRDAQSRVLGPDHPETLLTLDALATLYKELKKIPEAIALMEQVRNAQLKRFGPEHPITLAAMHNLAAAYRVGGRVQDAITLNEQVREARVRLLAPDDPDLLGTLNNLAVSYHDAARYSNAIPIFENLFQAIERVYGRDHPRTLTTLENYARAHQAALHSEEALKLFKMAAERYEANSRFRGPTDSAFTGLGECREALQQYEEAETWRRKFLAVAKERSGVDSLPYANAMAQLGFNLLLQKKWDAAEPLLRESLRLREKEQPDAWSTFNTRSMLGGVLLGQKKYSDAEPLLTSGYAGMKEREATILGYSRRYLQTALERLLQLYQDWEKAEPDSGRLEKAAYWQKQLDQLERLPTGTRL